MTGGQFMVVLIVAIVMIASVIRAKYTYRSSSGGAGSVAPQERAESLRLREEVKELKQRLQVLERIATDRENSLARQIDELRDR